MSGNGASAIEAIRAHVRNLADLLDVESSRIEEAITGAVEDEYQAARAEEGWIMRPDLPGPGDPEALPVEFLPSELRAHVQSVAGATQTPTDLSALLALATVSAAVAGTAEIRIDGRGWVEPLNVYAIAILPSGARKSAVFARFTAPLVAWERNRCQEVAPRRRAALDAVEAARAAHARAIKDGAVNEIEAGRQRLDGAEAGIPRLPRVIASDATPEALVRLLAENGGRIALLAPEGDPLRVADGRYDRGGAARLDELKRAHSGDAIRVDRVGRDPLHVVRPALTMGLTMQPSVLGSLQNRASFRGEGLLARVLWLQPDAGLGGRLTGDAVPPLDQEAARRFEAVVLALLDVAEEEASRTLDLDSAARAQLYAFEAKIERGIGPGGELEPVADWAAKAAGAAVRVAALLAIFGRAAEERPLWTPIDGGSMAAGIAIVEALTTHAKAVLGPVVDGEAERARHVLRIAADLAPGATLRDLFERVKGRGDLGTVEKLLGVLADLADRGCLRLCEVGREGRGRPPSPTVEVHPDLRTIRRNGNCANSANAYRRVSDSPTDDEIPTPVSLATDGKSATPPPVGPVLTDTPDDPLWSEGGRDTDADEDGPDEDGEL